MESGIEIIKRERMEHFTKHHQSIDDDVINNADGSLVRAACALLQEDFTLLPESWCIDFYTKCSHKHITERLAIAASLIAAEIDRISHMDYPVSMPEKYFYRVGTKQGGGMWYDDNGEHHGSINMPLFKMLTCHKVYMPHDKNIKGFLSVVESEEELKKWFSDEDMKVLAPLGFEVQKYKSNDYRKYNDHWIMKKDSCLLIV